MWSRLSRYRKYWRIAAKRLLFSGTGGFILEDINKWKQQVPSFLIGAPSPVSLKKSGTDLWKSEGCSMCEKVSNGRKIAGK
jgi:hypothetical protein